MAWILAGSSAANSEISSPDWFFLGHGSLDAVVDAIAHIHIKPPSLAKEGFVARGAAPMPVAGGLALAIRLRFHNHTPQQLSTCLAFHQQAANQFRCHLFRGAAEEGLGEGWEVLDGRGGYGSGCSSPSTANAKPGSSIEMKARQLRQKKGRR